MTETPYNPNSNSARSPEPPDRMSRGEQGYTAPMPTAPLQNVNEQNYVTEQSCDSQTYGASIQGSSSQPASGVLSSTTTPMNPSPAPGQTPVSTTVPPYSQTPIPDQASVSVGADQGAASAFGAQTSAPAADAASVAAAPVAAAAPSKKSGGVKTFFLAFIGALAACALAFAVNGALNTLSPSKVDSVDGGSGITAEESQSGITLGNQSPEAVASTDEDISLPEAVAEKAMPSVACIYVYSAQQSYYNYFGASNTDSDGELTQSSLGSGIVLTDDGYILTNYHVIEDSDALKVNLSGVEYDAEVVGTDPSSDLAVIKAKDASGLVAADIGDSDNLTVGQWVMTVGSPFGLEQSVATGVVSATSRSRIVEDSSSYSYGFSTGASEPTLYPNMIQTDAAINPGNSGGALVDANGKVIGVNTLIASYSGNYSGVGFAIPINYAINIADQIIAGKTPTHAKLGVSMTSITSDIAKRYGLPVEEGAYVSEVVADSSADEAGIKAGDIIVAIDGEKVATSTDLTLDIRAHNPGDKVTVTVNRDGEEMELSATLGSDEDDLAAALQRDQQQEQDLGFDDGDGRNLSYEDILRLFGML